MNRCHSFLVALILVYTSQVFGQPEVKSPLPTNADQQKAIALIKEVYGEEYASAKTDSQKHAFAKKLLGTAGESQDTTNRYVLLRVSLAVATTCGDGQMAFQAIDELDRIFQVDAVKMKVSVLSSLSKKARFPADHKSIAEQALALVDQGIAHDNFKLAGDLIEMALMEARKSREIELVKRIVASKKELEEIVKSYAEVKEVLAVLEIDPTNQDANLAVGKYRCFVKGDWDNGLPMLVLGNDAVLKALAVKEIGEVSRATEQVALGDGWWALIEKESKARVRATYWYHKALPGLTGLVKDKVKVRLAEVASGGREHKRWMVILRSSDPSIWNKDVNEGENRYSIRLDKVSDDIQWLKMQVPNKPSVIIPISKDRLGVLGNDGKYGWNGTGKDEWSARRLGVFSTERQGKVGEIAITGRAGRPHYLGWGFGGMLMVNKGQCYTWNGEDIPATVFEITVTDGSLTKEEKALLLE